jgi:hypothetical protein
MNRRRIYIVLIVGVLVVSSLIHETKRPKEITSNPGSEITHHLKAIEAPVSGFGGYYDLTSVQEISAQWRIPLIARDSPAGEAATWVGAKGPGVAFVQLGTLEKKTKASPEGQYTVVWSDSSVNYEPQTLMTVAAGDLVEAAMIRASDGWQFQFADITTGKTAPNLTEYNTNFTFNTAEWIQEDPANSTGTRYDAPYPTMSTVEFMNLKVNSAAPIENFYDGTTLSTLSGDSFSPTQLINDDFSLPPTTGAARIYLADVYNFNLLANLFDTKVNSNETPSAQLGAQLYAAYNQLDLTLNTQHWSGNYANEIKGVTTYAAHLAGLLNTWRSASANDKATALKTYVHATYGMATYSNPLRTNLDIPFDGWV